MTHPNPKRNIVPRAVLMRKGLVPFTTARPVNIVQSRPTVNSAKQMSNTFNKAHSFVKRPINKRTGRPRAAVNAARRKAAVNAARPKAAVNVARPRVAVNTTRPKAVLKAVKGNMVNVVKASTCWGRSNGCSRHMTENKSYLTDFEEIDGGFVAFGGSLKRVTKIPQSSEPTNLVADEAVTKEWEDKMERAATTASSLEAEQDSGFLTWRRQRLPVLECLTFEVLIEGRLIMLICSGLYIKDGSNGMQQLLGMKLELVLIHALIDGKKVVVSEATIRSVLQFGDEGGVEYLPTTIIFEEIARIGAKTTAWNKFSSTVASAIICLATNQQFNFSKYILEYSNTTPTITLTHITPTPTTSTPTTSTPTPTPNQPTTSVHLSQLQKQRVRKPARRDTEVSQPNEPKMVADADVQIERVTKQSNDPLSDITFVDGVEGRNDNIMFDVDELAGDEVVVEAEVAKDVNLNEDEVSLAQTLQKIKSTTPRTKGVIIREREQGVTQRIVIPKQKSKDKGKAKMIEPEQPLKVKDQISFDEQEARRLQAQFDEEARVANKEAQRIKEANLVFIEEWNNTQAKIDVDYELAQRLQQQEQEELTEAKKAKLFVQLLEVRKKHFAAKRAEEHRSKPPTKAQKRKTMSTYLKNMAGWKSNQLKNKSFDEI
ncbi:hypothetical protein Tco_1093921 [Tanacetum coccineum]|uniref:Uncharacterized protein n=1 Tax=Tanacetum coccineum TaxID=301880 RepID=A0ABQ5IE39_9ASTR